MNCVAYALMAFQILGIHLHTVPNVVVTYDIPYPGVYFPNVVYVQNPSDCAVMSHEFLHHAQFEHFGQFKNRMEKSQRERDASVWTMVIVMEMQERGFNRFQFGN